MIRQKSIVVGFVAALGLSPHALSEDSDSKRCLDGDSYPAQCRIGHHDECESSSHPFAIVDDEGEFVLERCYRSPKDALDVIRILRETGQCTAHRLLSDVGMELLD